jgi:hypothetical protein
MDASLVLVVDRLRVLALAASEVITANAGDDERKDRAAFAVASDVETTCLNVFGAKSTVEEEASPVQVRKGLFGALSLLPGLQATVSPAKLETDAAAASAAEAVESQAMKRAILTAQLQPITDITVVLCDDVLPPGYQRINWSVTGMFPADLNAVRYVVELTMDCAGYPAPPFRSPAVIWIAPVLARRRPPSYRARYHRALYCYGRTGRVCAARCVASGGCVSGTSRA